MSLDLPFKRLSGTAIGPTKAYESDAAFDLYADHDGSVGSISTVFDTNVALAIPSGYGGLLMGRSSLAKESIHPLGFVIEGPGGELRLGGCIDQYRGSIKVMLASVAPGGPWRAIKRGEAIAQIWILPIPEIVPRDVEDGELPPSDRGEKWAGSSNGRQFKGGVGSAPDPGPGTIVPAARPPKKAPGFGTLAREKFQADQKSRAEARYGRPCTLNDGTGTWEPEFPPIDADPFAGMIGGIELRAEWERKGRPPLPRYGSPHPEIEAAVGRAPEPAAILTPFVSVNPDIRPVEALDPVGTFDEAITATAREVADAIIAYPRTPQMDDDLYRDAIAGFVEDRFRNNFRLAGLVPGGVPDADHR